MLLQVQTTVGFVPSAIGIGLLIIIIVAIVLYTLNKRWTLRKQTESVDEWLDDSQ
ncbi:MAG: hypothetical protein ACFFFC_15880 [Candidatus Thorarchaeota archaeon]